MAEGQEWLVKLYRLAEFVYTLEVFYVLKTSKFHVHANPI